MHNIFIDGSSGTTGLKINDYLKNRTDINVMKIDVEKRKNIQYRLDMMSQADITFLCLPDQASEEIAKHIPPEVRVIDTATCHRINPNWTYGMAELTPNQRSLIAASNRVANPGCHASGFVIAVKPLIASGILPASTPLTATSLTGYSGGGKKMIGSYEDAYTDNLAGGAIYGLNQNHKHLPEMLQMTGLAKTPIFLPIVVNTFSGMAVTVPLHQEYMTKYVSLENLRETYQDYFSASPLIKVHRGVMPEGFIYSNSMANSNKAEIIVYGNNKRAMVTVLFDNLGKGASGSAVQNMNLMLGIDETRGLI